MIKIIFEVYMRVVLLFLTWYGLVIVWILSMYYKSFRSRVMYFSILRSKELNQSKFLKKNFIKTKIEIKIQSKSEENLLVINYLNDRLDIDFIKRHEKYFSNFYGHIIIFEYKAFIKQLNEERDLLGIAFFNLIDINMKYLDLIEYDYIKYFITDDYDLLMCRLLTVEDYNTIIFVLKMFFKDNNDVILKQWNKFFYETFNEIYIKGSIETMVLEKDTPIIFYDFIDLEDVIKYLIW